MDTQLIAFAKSIYRKIIPTPVRIELLRYKNYQTYKAAKHQHKKQKAQRKEVISFLQKELAYVNDPEKQSIVNFIKHNEYIVFPYEFVNKYQSKDIVVHTDAASNMSYVLHDNKRLYFPQGWDKESIQNTYNWLLIEQDTDSPHRYETDAFHVREGDIVADLGAAEGIFGLSVVERAKKLFLFECDEMWIKALEKTFTPWRDKVIIVNKNISDHTDGNYITLDAFLNGQGVDFVKADIEGAETKLLTGAQQTLATQKQLRLVLCTYHRENDAGDLKRMLTESGFKTTFSKGYMIFIHDEALAPPYLRRGLIRAEKA